MFRRNPTNHNRHTLRLRGWDYRSAAAFFITLMTYRRVCLFGDLANGQIHLNAYGRVIKTEWLRTAVIRPNIELDEFIIMPNHFHAIMVVHSDNNLSGGVKETEAELICPPSGSLGAIMAQFKSVCTKRINAIRKMPDSSVWQRNYYDRIIRNERELDATRQYIINNPSNWYDDPDNPNNVMNGS